ncbi:3437_t:CDS:2 [Ambispora leptoticha]|uniref:2'-phosphotransferase n=1 Tax=Ambispora leptoticha TaxID=144679 RepID=A0A9N8V925_9GLOM|nr:3437_t:CDS:2 [Ambispora leptoticha]
MSSHKNRKARDDPTVRLSKTLSYILRHGATKEGLQLRSDGYIEVDELLNLPKLRGRTFADIESVVLNNDKQRFKLLEEVSGDGKSTWYIRANQGHSIEVEQLELEKITDAALFPQVIHGTFLSKWKAIYSTGLSKMNRNHMHFSVGRWGDPNVTSGVRATCDLFIYVDIEKAMADGIEFFRSENGVILSTGINGILPIQYFKKVEDLSGNILGIGIPPPPLPRGSSWRPDYNIDRGGRGGGRWQNPPYNSSYRNTPYTTQRPPRNSSSSYPNYAPGGMNMNHRGNSSGRGGYNTLANTPYAPRGRGRGISPWSTPTSSRPPPVNVAELNVTAYYKKSMLEDPWIGLL